MPLVLKLAGCRTCLQEHNIPFTTRDSRVNTEQVSLPTQLHNEVYGNGDPFLCLHGLGASSYSWRHFIQPFSQHYKLILIDSKGCGKSPKPLDNHYSLAAKVDEIYNIILQEDLKNLTLCGNSLGGAIAMLLAIRLAKHEPTRLAKLVLIDSAGDTRYLPTHFKLARSLIGAATIYLSPSRLAARTVLRMCYYDRAKITPEDVAAYAGPLASSGGRHALLRTTQQCIPPNADELLAKAREITVPTLILWGRQDKIIPLKVGELLRELIPNSTLEIIEECGHVPQEEKPAETIQRILRFMAAN
jgi:pimeloyl-ACP methyl ester carboxylesterase